MYHFHGDGKATASIGVTFTGLSSRRYVVKDILSVTESGDRFVATKTDGTIYIMPKRNVEVLQIEVQNHEPA